MLSKCFLVIDNRFLFILYLRCRLYRKSDTSPWPSNGNPSILKSEVNLTDCNSLATQCYPILGSGVVENLSLVHSYAQSALWSFTCIMRRQHTSDLPVNDRAVHGMHARVCLFVCLFLFFCVFVCRKRLRGPNPKKFELLWTVGAMC